MDLEKTIKEEINKVNFKEMIKKKTEDSVSALINECLNDVFRSYGNLAKTIKDQINKSLSIDLTSSLAEYNKTVSDIIKDQVSTEITSKAQDLSKELILNHLKKLEKDNYGLKDFFTEFIYYYDEILEKNFNITKSEYNDEEWLDECSEVISEEEIISKLLEEDIIKLRRYEFQKEDDLIIYFNTKGSYLSSEIISLNIVSGKLNSAEIKNSSDFSLGKTRGFKEFVSKLYLNKATVIIEKEYLNDIQIK